MNKFQNKYRIPSARLQNWDYGRDAAYFITICTENREHYFGEIFDGRMNLSDIGSLAQNFWIEIPNQFLFAKLDVHVVMPNHMHGILIIDKSNGDLANGRNYNANDGENNKTNDDANVETRLIASLPPVPTTFAPPSQKNKTGGFAGNKNPMVNENISRVVRWFKGRCSFEMRKIHAGFEWQSRFHDHIIRNNEEFQRIRNYILHNPENWKEDKFFQ